MSFAARARRLAGLCTICAVALVPVPALSQEISESHLKAARDMIAAIHVTDRFDNILPAAAVGLKTNLLRSNPDQEGLIDQTVDEKTIAMAARRGDLEREAATAFARVFTEDELKAITAFYSEPAGKKFIEKSPQATGEVYKAAEIWQRGVVRDLTQSVTEALQAKLPKAQSGAAPAPADGKQPAADPNDVPAAPAPSGN